MYINLRCRKCGQYLSIETDNPYPHILGYTLKKIYHNCPNGIADDEQIFCDLISNSDNPIGEIIKKNKIN
jgi:hypothetical protein